MTAIINVVTPADLGSDFDIGTQIANKINIANASTTQAGKVRFATPAEIAAGASGVAVDAGQFQTTLAAINAVSATSPAFAGNPTAPTAAAGTNTTQIATTAFVVAALAAYPVFTAVAKGAVPASGGGTTNFLRADGTWAPVVVSVDASGGTTGLNFSGGPITTSGTVTLGGVLSVSNGGTGATTVAGALSNLGVASSASPALTGTPTAPTAALGTNTTQLATTAFVQSAVSQFGPLDVLSSTSTTAALSANQGYILNNKIISLGATTVVANIAARNALTPGNLDIAHVLDDGTSNWARYQYIGGSWVLISDQELFSLGVSAMTGATAGTPGAAGTVPAPAAGQQGYVLTGNAQWTDILASPVLTGSPVAPTPSAGTNNTAVATTAFVQAALNNTNFANIAALQLASTTLHTLVYLEGYWNPFDGGEGVFQWDGSNLATQVAGDPYMGVYVPPSGGDGSTGAWRRITSSLNAAFFGVKSDGSAGVSARLNSMFAFNDGRNLPCFVNDGTYSVDATLNLRDGIKVVFSQNAIMKRTFSGTPLVDAIGTAPLSNVYFAGGQWGDPTLTFTGVPLKFWCDDSVVENVVISGWKSGLAFTWCGDRFIINKIKATGTVTAAGNGGIRFLGGKDSYAYNCYVESGDDALQFVPSPAPTVSPAPQTNLSISGCWYVNCYGMSAQGRSMIVNMRATAGTTLTASITDSGFISTSGVSPQDGGQTIGSSILVYNANSTGNIDGVRFIGCNIDVADNVNNTAAVWLLNDGTNGGSVKNIRGDITIRNTVGQALVASGVDNVRLDIYSDIPSNPPTPATSVTKSAVYVTNSTNVFIGGKIGVAPNQTQSAFGVDGTSKRVYLKDAAIFGFLSASSNFNLVNLNAGYDCGLDNVRFEAAGVDSFSRISVGAGMTSAYLKADVSQLGFSALPNNRLSNSGVSTRIDPACIGLGQVNPPVALSINGGAPTPDMFVGRHFNLTVTQAATFQIPLNQVVGQTGYIIITQDTTGYPVNFVAAYNLNAGTSVDVTPGSVTVLEYFVAAINNIRLFNT